MKMNNDGTAYFKRSSGQQKPPLSFGFCCPLSISPGKRHI